MDAYSQENRHLQIDTALGNDHFWLTAVDGEEAISSAYFFDLALSSTDFDVKPDDLLGTAATIVIRGPDGREAKINGIVSRFEIAGRHGTRTICNYRARLVPAVWLLTRTSDCRIFQDKTVKDIIEQILSEHAISKKDWRLTGSHDKRVYCVQYRETAFDFMCRLLEEEGIFFYFQHDDKSHTIVFSDNNRGLAQCANDHVPIVPKPEGFGATLDQVGGIWDWQHGYRMRSGRWALADFNFETPSTDLTTQKKTINSVLGKQGLERFDFPGRYLTKGPGQNLTGLRIEYEEAAYQEVAGEGASVGFSTGGCFTLSNAPDSADANIEYFLTAVGHSARDMSLVAQDADQPTYVNRFRCRPRSVPYRPEMKTPVPRIHGLQTAIVTGPGGSEICTDKYGRIKVQFHWDRYGKKDEHSSCWIRVAQSWAGAGWGSWAVPRIGQEVVVAFLEGDPDRPLVVGSVYNAEQMVPFSLPGNATQTGIRTRSSMHGGAANCNELRFEDKKGSEQVYFHAERNLDISVELDETHQVGHDQTITVDHDQSVSVLHDRKKAVLDNEMSNIGVNRTETVGQNEMVTIGLTRTHSVGTVDTLTVGAARVHTVGAAEAISVGAAQTVEIGDDRSVSIGSNETFSVAKDRSTSIGDNDSLNVGKNLSINAGDQIVLTTGSASITMKKNGDITIEGKQITIKGSGDVVIKGQKILQN